MRIRSRKIVFVMLTLMLGTFVASAEESGTVPADSLAVNGAPAAKPFYVKRGRASWYGKRFNGRRTASGERFNKNELTCAHRWLPFGSLVRVTNTNTGESVIVRVNDRGPYVGKRIIDLSEAAAREIGMIGCATVVIEAYADTLADALDTAMYTTAPQDAETDAAADSADEIPAISRESIAAVKFVNAALSPAAQTNERTEEHSIIVDYRNRRVDVHGYTVVAAVARDYKTASRLRDALLARGFRTVHLRVTAIDKETHFEVCVGLEPVAIACERIADHLLPEYPTATITYIESKRDDTYQTTACAD